MENHVLVNMLLCSSHFTEVYATKFAELIHFLKKTSSMVSFDIKTLKSDANPSL